MLVAAVFCCVFAAVLFGIARPEPFTCKYRKGLAGLIAIYAAIVGFYQFFDSWVHSSLLAAVAGMVFAPDLVALFSSDPAVLAYGEVALRLQCLSFPLTAWFVMCTMLTQTMGRVVSASFLSLARQGLFFIPLVVGLPLLFAHTTSTVDPILGVQMALPLSDAATALVSIPVCVSVMRKYLREEQKNT